MTDLSRSADFLIVGAGIAGAALAWELSRRQAGSIVLMEQEILPGAHASGRNAALVLQNVEDEVNGRMARYGGRFYVDPPADLAPSPGFRRNGSLLLHSGPDWRERVEVLVERAGPRGLEVVVWSAEDAARRVPILDPSRFDGGVFCPDDGVIDIHALLQAFLASALDRGVRVMRRCTAMAIETAGGRVTGVTTSEGRIAAGSVINAAGGWANELAATAGVTIPALRPTRRHLFVTEPSGMIDTSWPFVWDVDRPFYFRPESGGLLLCACDVAEAPGLEETVDPAVLERTAALASRLIPKAASLGVAHAWSGIRTLTPDDRPVIGPDPRLPGFFWLAGLAGHGIVAAPAAARVAADLLTSGSSDLIEAEALAPERFIPGRVPG